MSESAMATRGKRPNGTLLPEALKLWLRDKKVYSATYRRAVEYRPQEGVTPGFAFERPADFPPFLTDQEIEALAGDE